MYLILYIFYWLGLFIKVIRGRRLVVIKMDFLNILKSYWMLWGVFLFLMLNIKEVISNSYY